MESADTKQLREILGKSYQQQNHAMEIKSLSFLKILLLLLFFALTYMYCLLAVPGIVLPY